jgi:hypothetical protein
MLVALDKFVVCGYAGRLVVSAGWGDRPRTRRRRTGGGQFPGCGLFIGMRTVSAKLTPFGVVLALGIDEGLAAGCGAAVIGGARSGGSPSL